MDFFSQVPTSSTAANLEWRLKIRRAAAKDAGLRRALKAACKEDILFMLCGFAWLHEPRPRFDERGQLLPRVFPFLTWPHQNKEFVRVRKYLGLKDIGVEKCRGEGWSWFMCWAAIQFWCFEEDTQVGLVSSTEDKSDSPNLGSLLGKVGWGIDRLPKWMVGAQGKSRTDGDWYRNLGEHSFVHLRNRTQINAFAASPDTGRGDRFTWFGLDEHASDEWKKEAKDERVLDSIRGATDSILYISTPKGATGAFHRIMHTPSNIEKVYIDWRDNPTKNRGLYRLVKGVPEAVDPINNPLPPHYNPPDQATLDLFSRLRKNGFSLDEKTRSEWLDRECDRGGATPQSIAQEHERDYGGALAQIFGPMFMEKIRESTRGPDIIGELSVFDDLTYEFDRVANGQMYLWCPLDSRNRPPHRQYVVCADIASGEGGLYCSNSVLSVIDLTTREQVLEYATRVVKPVDFADKAIAVAKWFHGAYLAWEHMGPGTAFTSRIVDRKYRYCHERLTTDKASRKTTKRLGIINRGDARESLFGDLEKAIRSGSLIVRSPALLDEFPQYIREGKVIRHVSTKSDDSSHGDRVIALGVGVQALKNRPALPPQEEVKGWNIHGEPPAGTLAHIIWKNEQSKRPRDVCDRRSMVELTRAG